MTSEFLALNPKHKIPVMRHGALVLSESAAIVSYLSRIFPPPDGFCIPEGEECRARLDEWCFFIMTELDALATYVIRKHLDLAEIYGEAPKAVEAAKAQFADQAAAAFGLIDRNQPFLMAEGMSVADILLTTCVDSAMRRGIDMPAFLIGYHERMTGRPAYRRAFARNFPGRALPGAD